MITTMKKTILAAAFVVVLGIAAASAQTVTGSIGKGTVTRGTATRATVTLRIPGGLHVNSSRPSGEYMIPTTVRVSSTAGVKLGRVTYPRGNEPQIRILAKGDQRLRGTRDVSRSPSRPAQHSAVVRSP